MEKKHLLVDQQFGLSQLGGNQALLLTLYTRLFSEYSNCSAQVESLLQQKQVEQAHVLVHTLKGVAGNLGCNPLFESSHRLEKELKQHILPPPSLDEFTQMLHATMAELNTILHGDAIPAPAPPSIHITSLIEALQNNEFVSPEHLEKCMSTLECSVEEKQRLARAINTLDYKTALETLLP